MLLRRRVLSPLLGLFLPACGWHHPRSSADLFPATSVIMGHRGARGLAPENTDAGFARALELGVPVELDTMMCASGELVVLHDEDLGRLAGVQARVADTPWSRLSQLDVGSHFSGEFAGQRVPLLSDVLERYGSQLQVNIEVKAPKGSDVAPVAQRLVALLDDLQLTEKVIVTSFSPLLLEQVRLAKPEIRRGQIYGRFRNSDLSRLEKFALRRLLLNRRAQPDLLMMEHVLAKPRYVRRMKRRGYRIFTWTVNDPQRAAALLQLGVDGIITDRPDLMLGLQR